MTETKKETKHLGPTDKDFQLEVTDYEYAAVTIDSLLINAEFERVPGDLAYYNAMFADAQKKEAEAKLERDRTLATVDATERKAAAEAGEKTTEKVIESRVRLNALTIAAEQALVDAGYRAQMARTWADAVRTKKDMIVAIGLQIRAEMGGDPTVREQYRGYRQQAEEQRRQNGG